MAGMVCVYCLVYDDELFDTWYSLKVLYVDVFTLSRSFYVPLRTQRSFCSMPLDGVAISYSSYVLVWSVIDCPLSYIHNYLKPVVRAIEVSHAACKHEFR